MSKSRLRLTPLEDRCTPASFVGNVITLDDGGEQLTISTDTSGQYTLSSSVDVNNEGNTGTFTPTGPVSIVDSVGSTSVLFANSTAAYAHNFSVNLNDGSQGVRFDGATAFDRKELTVIVDRGIAVNPLAVVSSSTGVISFAANMQTAPRIGEFIGVDVQGQITSTDYGGVSVVGRGGLLNVYGMIGVQVLGKDAKISTLVGGINVEGIGGSGSGDANIGVHVAGGAKVFSDGGIHTVTGTGGAGPGQGNYGVLVQNANSGIISTRENFTVKGTAGANGTKSYGVGVYVNDGGKVANGTTGSATVMGIGGGSSGSAHNIGVFVVGTGSIITSSGAAVLVTGVGGGGSGGGSTGVHVAEGGVVSSTTSGSATITGTGGSGTGDYNVGVMVQGLSSAISSTNGDVSIEGTAGANGGSRNMGVLVYNAGQVKTASNGTLNVKGTGKGPNYGHNHGVLVLEEGANITGNGSVLVTGSAPSTGKLFSSQAVFVSNNGSISSTTNVSIDADALSIDPGTGSISAGTGTVTIQPRTTGLKISLGGSGTPILNLLNAELARITAGTLVIGNSGAGEIRVTNPVDINQSIADVQLWTGSDIASERNTTLNVGKGRLTMHSGGNIVPPNSNFVPPNNTGVPAFIAETTTLAAGSKVAVAINGQLADQYSHLDVTGALNLNNATLALSGNFIPVKASMFTLVTAGNLTGTFTNAPESTVVVLNGVSLRISYTATSVTATVV
jgi:hypothetical protein